MPLEKKRGPVKGALQKGSRKERLTSLAVGEFALFPVMPGQTCQDIMASIGSGWRDGDTMVKEGLNQKVGLLVFEGELTQQVVRVKRIKERE